MTHPTDEELDALVKRFIERAKEDRQIQANNEAVAVALKGQKLLFEQGVRSQSNTFAVRLGLDYENCAKKDAQLASDWEQAADTITTLRAQLAEARAEIARLTDLNSTAYIDGHDAAKNEYRDEIQRLEVLNAQLTVMSGEDAVEQIEAALAAQIEVKGWQPIETAPTDCTHVIGIDAKGCVARTRFFTPSSLTREWLRVGLPGKAIWHPTHWKPLHEPDAQPHDRSAIARYRETVLREAADELKGQGYNTAVRQILALIEREGV